jgi:2-dehydropantoate 2-reductase
LTSTAEHLRVAVLGTGAVGAYLGALLNLAGVPALLIGRPRIVDPIREAGLTLRDDLGRSQLCYPPVAVDVAAISQKFDIVLLAVKAYSVQAAIPDLQRLMDEGSTVLSFQNGVGSDRLLVEEFGAESVVAATSTVSVGIDEPSVLQQYTSGGGLAWSPYVGSRNAECMGRLLERTSLPVARIQTPESLKWSKLLLNAVGSAQSAILQIDLNAIVSDPRLFRVEQRAFRERLGVMAAAGIAVVDLPGYRVRLAARAMGLPSFVARVVLGRRIATGRGGKSPTLRADVARGGPTENDYLNGATAALGADVGVLAPVNATLTRIVDEVTASAERRRKFDGNVELLLAELKPMMSKGGAR